jgi:glutathione synthase/RimK-type ligase-like ATP-grasp enzyme
MLLTQLIDEMEFSYGLSPEERSAIGFAIPETIATNDPARARVFYDRHNGNIVIKALHHHDVVVGRNCYSMFTHFVSSKDLNRFEDLTHAPCLLQETISARTELRVTVIGESVFAAQIEARPPSWQFQDIHRVSADQLTKIPVTLPAPVEEACRELVNTLGLRYGAVDFLRREAGDLIFLEVILTEIGFGLNPGLDCPLPQRSQPI